MLTRQQALDEAQRQKDALKTIARWRQQLFLVTACFVPFAFYGLQGSGVRFGVGVGAAVLGAITLLLTFIVNLSIRNGHRNVEKILDSIS